MTALALALTSLVLNEPAPLPPAKRGTMMIRFADHYAESGRRDRRWAGGLRLSLGAVHTGLGIYGVVSPRYTPAIRRAAIAQTGFGLSGVGFGLVALLRPSSSERLASSDELTALREDPSDPARVGLAETRWDEVALRARRWRLLVGAGYFTAGVTLVTIGAVFAFSPVRVVSDDEKFWAYSTLTTGVSTMITGTLGLAIRSPIERGRSLYRASTRGGPVRRLTVRPSLGSAMLSGRF